MSLLTEKASTWALTISQNNPSLCPDFQAFSRDHPVWGKEAVNQLLSLTQEKNSISQYTIDFRILATECSWDQIALEGVFLKGLSEEIKDDLATRDETSSLEKLIG